jgi:hypothetical protein
MLEINGTSFVGSVVLRLLCLTLQPYLYSRQVLVLRTCVAKWACCVAV